MQQADAVNKSNKEDEKDDDYAIKTLKYAKLAQGLLRRGKFHLLGIAFKRRFPTEAEKQI